MLQNISNFIKQLYFLLNFTLKRESAHFDCYAVDKRWITVVLLLIPQITTLFVSVGMVGFLVFVALYLYNRSGPSVDYKLYYTLLKAQPSVDECHIPKPDPWDDSIKVL